MFRRQFIGAITLSATALVGCAQEVGDIDRTYPNRIEKAALTGEWYMMQTVVDTNATAMSSFPGLQGDLERIEFEIEEDVLILRRTHEDVIGIDTDGINVPETSWDGGTPVAAFPISSHFDIQRQYNSSTGEQTNVISENSSDRDWQFREYVRVDWTRQQMENPFWDSFLEIQNMASVVIAPQDSTAEPTWFVERDENGQVNYIDVLNTYYIEPDWLECVLNFGLPIWGAKCGPETVKVRTSLVRITPETDRDFEARPYSETDLAQFGFFTTSRCVFDRRYECVDQSKAEFANIWNLWQDGTDESGNPIPYAQRQVRPIAYYYNDEWPIDTIGVTYEATEQWSVAFRRIVAALQNKSIDDVPRMFYGCLNTGTAEEAAEILAFADTMRNATRAQAVRDAVAASNEGYDNGACANRGVAKNLGDMRYSSLNWVNNGPWVPWGGYGPSGQDPLTGETVQGAANINGANYDWASQRTLEFVKVIAGELTAEEMGYGSYIDGYFEQLRAEAQDDVYLDLLPEESNDAQKSLLYQGALQRSAARIMANVERVDHLRQVGRDVLARPSTRAALSRPLDDYRMTGRTLSNVLAAQAGTYVEQSAMVPELVDAQNQLIEAGLSQQQALDAVSPLRMLNDRSLFMAQERFRQDLLSRNIHLATDFDPYMLGFAQSLMRYRDELIAGGMEPGPALDDEIYLEIRATILAGVIEHEIGHTVGLRHNFSGSMDAMNFHPEYWSLRERTINDDCDDAGFSTFDPYGLAAGDVAPDNCQNETVAERATRSAALLAEIQDGVVDEDTRHEGGIYEYMYSSIMDYDPKVNTHSSGLGLYDYAAVAYGYGALVEVFAEPPRRLEVITTYNESLQPSVTIAPLDDRVTDMADIDLHRTSISGVTVEETPGDIQYRRPWHRWHYSVLPMMFGDLVASVDTADTAQVRRAVSYDGLDTMAAMYDRILVRSDALTDSDVVVPYRYCEDYAEGSSIECRVFDLGADPYEAMVELQNRYETSYYTSFFRRGRRAFGLDVFGLVNGMYSRYFTRAREYYSHMIVHAGARFDWLTSDYGGGPEYLAAIEAANFVARAFTTPAPGTYVADGELGSFVHVSENEDFVFDTSTGTFSPVFNPEVNDPVYLRLGLEDGARFARGRFVEDELAEHERGYHYFLYDDILPHFWTKYAALFAMTSGDTPVIGADISSNSSAYWIPFNLVFEDDVMALFAGMLTDDFELSGRCVREENGEFVVEPIDMVQGNGYRGCVATGGQLLNANDYGDKYFDPTQITFYNNDYNMRQLIPVFGAANWDTTLDPDWFTRAGIFVSGTGEMPETQSEDHYWITYTSATGVTFAALARNDAAPDTFVAADVMLGASMIQRMNDLAVRAETLCIRDNLDTESELVETCGLDESEACLWQWLGEDSTLAADECGVDVSVADEFLGEHSEAELDLVSDYGTVNFNLESLEETARHIARTNQYFNMFDGEVSW